MDDAWWMPVLEMPDGTMAPLLAERQYPGQLIVNQAGERFVNEAAPYTDFVHAQIKGHASGVSHIPAWMITDDRARRRNFMAGLLPGQPIPREWFETGIARQAPTLAELALEIDVPADALEATVDRFNEMARGAVDRDFHRGESAYDNFYGDFSYKNPNLAEVGRAPFYAFALVPGDLGTKGGLLTNEDAQVLGPDGTPIPGLYATGNTSAAVMGNDYAGPGATLGPAMTFGFVAARHIAEN